MEEQEFLNEIVPDGPPILPQTPNRPDETATVDPRLEDYLDHLCAPLIGIMSYAERQELRAEVRTHLESLVAAYEELGAGPTEAVAEALRQFGPADRIARRWAQAWTPPCTSPWPAMRAGLGWFSAAFAGTVAFFVTRALEFGNPFFNVGDFEVPHIAAAMPLTAGLLTGLLSRGRQTLGAFYAVSLLVLLNTLCSGWLLPPTYRVTGLSLAFVQLIAWIPYGCLGAALGGWLRARIAQARRRAWTAC